MDLPAFHIGGVGFRIDLEPRRPWFDQLVRDWQAFRSASPLAEGCWRVRVKVRADEPVQPSGLLPEIRPGERGTRELHANGLRAVFGDGFVEVEQGDSRQSFEDVLKVVIAEGARRAGGLLVHSVALGKDRAAVFVGQSGAGKSTLGNLGVQVGLLRLADELVAVTPDSPGCFIAHGTPWNVGRPDARPLAWLGTLAHAPHNRLVEVAGVNVLRVLLNNVLVPDPSAEGRREIFRLASALVARMPARSLEFAPVQEAARLVGERL